MPHRQMGTGATRMFYDGQLVIDGRFTADGTRPTYDQARSASTWGLDGVVAATCNSEPAD